MVGKFELRGTRRTIRLEEELAGIDKETADGAFKKYKKSILDEFLLGEGFCCYRTNAYVRKNPADVLEYMDLQKEHYGSKTFTVNYAMMPLYVPHDSICLGFGGRLGTMVCGRDVWWDFADEKAAKVSFQNVKEAMDRFVLPWFEKYSDEEWLKERLLKDKSEYEKKRLGIPYKNHEWLQALDERGNRQDMISENMKKLKLPKGIL